ncbi:ubiquinol-cytochrome C chaperone family protein, partial [Citrobacter sp. HN-141]
GAFAGPVGWVLSSLWLLIDLAGPAYRVTLPSCIFIAYMRQKHLYWHCCK